MSRDGYQSIGKRDPLAVGPGPAKVGHGPADDDATLRKLVGPYLARDVQSPLAMYETHIPNTRAAHRMMERKNRRKARIAEDSASPRPVHGLELEEIDELRHWHFELVDRCLRLARLLERELGGGLGEWRMLRAVALGRAQSDAIGDIGEQLGFHKQYARELVASLAQKKKVQVRIDPIRPAAKIVLLTAAGAESLRGVVEEFAETFEAIFEGMVDHHFESFDYAVRSIESTLRKRRSRRR